MTFIGGRIETLVLSVELRGRDSGPSLHRKSRAGKCGAELMRGGSHFSGLVMKFLLAFKSRNDAAFSNC